jgi:hypothetical protein
MGTLSTMVVKLVAETGPFVTAMEGAANKAKDFAGTIATGAAAGVAAIGAAMVASIAKTVEWGDTLDSLGDVLGTNADESAALAVAIRGVGGDVGAITGQMAKLVNGLDDGNGKLSTSGKALTDLGIAFRDTNGQLLPATTLLTSVADKLSTMPDGLEKTRIMTELFGKSGKDLSDTMNALANGGLAAAGEKAQAFGLAIGEDGVNKSIAFKKGMADLQMAGEGLMITLGNELLPILVPLLQKFTEFAQKAMPEVRKAIENVVAWVQTNLVPVFNTLGVILANPFEYARTVITTVILDIERFFVKLINGIITDINNVTNEMARVTGTTNDLFIPLLQERQIQQGTNGGFAYGMGGAGEVTPAATGNNVQMGGLVINLAPGQTAEQGAQAADAFVRAARAQGLIVA